MASFESIAFYTAMASLVLALVSSIWHLVSLQRAGKTNKSLPSNLKRGQRLIFISLVCSLAALSLTIIFRAIETGHGPFSNMYEFAIALAWGIVALSLFYWWRYKIVSVSSLSSFLALGLVIYASTLPSKAIPLVPALQQSLLLSTHVAAAVVAYGAFCVGFITAVMYLIQQRKSLDWLPETRQLDRIGYHTVILGFPFLTLTIILGAVWAEAAWGTYWSWDPKETASLVTWLFYAGYLHTRMVGSWRGSRSATLLIIGFAAVLLTFFGNYIFAGLHIYD